LSSLVLHIAAGVISKSSRDNPADLLLREALASRRVPSREETRDISRAVFNYFRWLGWLERKRPLPGQIKYALELAQAFKDRPDSFSDEKLVGRVVLDWVREQMEVSPAWARAIQGEPKLWLRARRGQGGALVEKLGAAKVEQDSLPEAVRYNGEEDLFRRAEFHAGEFEIQDIASQAVGWLCAPKPGETWWDACAGEGGKLLHLSDLMENKGLIWASDRAAWRLQKLKRRTARAKAFNYRAALWDGGAKLPTKTKFDGVLVDAPCSGIGTWQRNPHARWTTTTEDVEEMAEVQGRLLAHVAPSVKPGGKLIYAVCTPTRSETESVVKTFNDSQPAFEPLALPDNFSESESHSLVPPGATMTIWPQDLGGNGMFVAAWRRKS
jgi:16S rRNA (cytosine967-C5)-methyltransferase